MSKPSNEFLLKNKNLRQQLEALIRASSVAVSPPYSVVITPCEVNTRHGTGILLQRIFGNSPQIFSVRSHNFYNAEHQFGTVSVCALLAKPPQRTEAFAKMMENLQDKSVQQIICIPFNPEDALLAIAIKEISGAPLCTYIMDDQNIYARGIPDALMEELLSKSALRFAISPEMRRDYEKKYGEKFFWMPPVVPDNLLRTTAGQASGEYFKSKRGILVGNIWGHSWFSLLRDTIKESGLEIDWYGHGRTGSTTVAQDDPQLFGIRVHSFLPEPQLVPILRSHPYAVVPCGTLDRQDETQAIARLSLLSRVPFITATSGTPIIILGSKDTAVAKFVERFQVGVVAEYTAASFLEAVNQVMNPATQQAMRQNAAALAKTFAVDGIERWIWNSLEQGTPEDDRFERLVPRREDELVHYIESPVPKQVLSAFVPAYQVLKRLQQQGFQPDFVVDVGASTGVWSDTANRLFPTARFVLVEPLMSRHDQQGKAQFIDRHPNFEVAELALSDQPGTAQFQVSADLYGSSLLAVGDFREYESIEVEVSTLDRLAIDRNITGKGLLKIDVQCAEHLVLAGGQAFLSQIEVVIVELSLVRYSDTAKVYTEMLKLLQELGFRYYDDAGDWRLPTDGTLLQKDAVFVREGAFLPCLQ